MELYTSSLNRNLSPRKSSHHSFSFLFFFPLSEVTAATQNRALTSSDLGTWSPLTHTTGWPVWQGKKILRNECNEHTAPRTRVLWSDRHSSAHWKAGPLGTPQSHFSLGLGALGAARLHHCLVAEAANGSSCSRPPCWVPGLSSWHRHSSEGQTWRRPPATPPGAWQVSDSH